MNDFTILFCSTVAASLTMIILQSIWQFVIDRRKKLYAITYFLDMSFRMMFSAVFLNKHTIIPHIEATKRIIKGDQVLLNTMFLADDFDVLTDEPFQFNVLPEEYKVLIGLDDINLIQSYEFLAYTSRNTVNRKAFNEFVRNNLKSQLKFGQESEDIRNDILNTYWDYMDKLQRDENRIVFHVLYTAVPQVKEYVQRKEFLFFSKKNINRILSRIDSIVSEYKDILPEEGKTIQDVVTGGIQRAL
jgi:hypothetical protein